MGREVWIILVVVALGDLMAIVREIANERHCVWRPRQGDEEQRRKRQSLSPQGANDQRVETPESPRSASGIRTRVMFSKFGSGSV